MTKGEREPILNIAKTAESALVVAMSAMEYIALDAGVKHGDIGLRKMKK